MDIAAFLILLLFSFVGFILIFFTTFGTFIIMLGVVLTALMTELRFFDLWTLGAVIFLYLLGELLEYLLVVLGAKKLGASNWAVVGAILGGIVGAILGISLFGIGLLPATLLFIFLGGFIPELFIKKDAGKAFLAATGGVLGRLGSVAAKVIIAFMIFGILALKIAQYSG